MIGEQIKKEKEEISKIKEEIERDKKEVEEAKKKLEEEKKKFNEKKNEAKKKLEEEEKKFNEKENESKKKLEEEEKKFIGKKIEANQSIDTMIALINSGKSEKDVIADIQKELLKLKESMKGEGENPGNQIPKNEIHENVDDNNEAKKEEKLDGAKDSKGNDANSKKKPDKK